MLDPFGWTTCGATGTPTGTTIFVVATSVAGVDIIVDTTRMRVYGAAERCNGGGAIKGGLVVDSVCVIAEGVLAGWRSGMLAAGEAFVMTISTISMHRWRVANLDIGVAHRCNTLVEATESRSGWMTCDATGTRTAMPIFGIVTPVAGVAITVTTTRMLVYGVLGVPTVGVACVGPVPGCVSVTAVAARVGWRFTTLVAGAQCVMTTSTTSMRR